MKKALIVYIFIVCLFTAFSGASYTAWNMLDPKYTCAQCHEVDSAHARWKNSAHKNVACYECHGTALSEWGHSVAEKCSMVISHFSKKVGKSDIKIGEDAALKISSRCAECHQNEYEQWRQGAHSTRYKDIFENVAHNKSEKPYGDCFRCHGMFYEGGIENLMNLDGECQSWKIVDRKQAEKFAVPCLACHAVHTPKICGVPKTSFYARAERAHFGSAALSQVQMYLDGAPLKTSKDPNNTLCVQCHSPDWTRTAHTSDDRTPTGAHKGFSCLVCHNPHSNSAALSCVKCHDDSPKYSPKDNKCNY